MNPLLIGGGWLASLIAASWFFYGAGQDNVKAVNSDKAAFAAEIMEIAQTGAAKAIAEQVPINKTIYAKVQHEIETNTVYAECRNTPVGMSSVNAALTGRAIPASGSKLP